MERGKILDEAKRVINGERQDAYGNPEDNFQVIADLWSAYLKREARFVPQDVAMMMALLKIARIRTGTGTCDSFVDCAGYVALAADMGVKNA